MARAGLASLNPSDDLIDYFFGGSNINHRLEAFSRVYAGTSIDLDAVRQDLAEAHIRAVSRDTSGIPGLLSPEQIAEYHHDVFRDYGLPSTAFGGTPHTGAVEEANYTRLFWCRDCDRE